MYNFNYVCLSQSGSKNIWHDKDGAQAIGATDGAHAMGATDRAQTRESSD